MKERSDFNDTESAKGLVKEGDTYPGEAWMLFFRTVRKSDGKRVKNKIPVGLVRDSPDKSRAWAEVERQHIHVMQGDFDRWAV
jgi:hypothetical protein